MKTIENTIKIFIVDDVFSKHPGSIGYAFDYFMEADVDVDTTESVSLSELAFNYEVCEKYETENIRAIRDLMQSMYNDLERLKSALFQQASHTIQINKDEIISESAFYDIAQYPNAILRRQGTADEFVTFITISEESVS